MEHATWEQLIVRHMRQAREHIVECLAVGLCYILIFRALVDSERGKCPRLRHHGSFAPVQRLRRSHDISRHYRLRANGHVEQGEDWKPLHLRWKPQYRVQIERLFSNEVVALYGLSFCRSRKISGQHAASCVHFEHCVSLVVLVMRNTGPAGPNSRPVASWCPAEVLWLGITREWALAEWRRVHNCYYDGSLPREEEEQLSLPW